MFVLRCSKDQKPGNRMRLIHLPLECIFTYPISSSECKVLSAPFVFPILCHTRCTWTMKTKKFHFVNDSLNLIAKEDVQFGYFRSLEKCRSSIRLFKESVLMVLDHTAYTIFSEITSLNRIRNCNSTLISFIVPGRLILCVLCLLFKNKLNHFFRCGLLFYGTFI